MKLFFVCLYLLLSGNDSEKPVLKAVYRTHIHSTYPISFTPSSTTSRKDSLLNEFSKEFLRNLEKKGFDLLLQDSIVVYRDSAIIITTPSRERVNENITMQLRFEGDSVVHYQNGKFYTVDSDGRFKDDLGDKALDFYNTGKKEMILGYNTTLFLSGDSTQKVWVTKDLPLLLNPRVKIKDPKGAILKYERRDGHDFTTSIVEKIFK